MQVPGAPGGSGRHQHGKNGQRTFHVAALLVVLGGFCAFAPGAFIDQTRAS
ncbi:hypothetical protein PCLA_11r0156 [Pseudomonas citronellolis]|nr:hypothetical protein PCLA_11r0156 [Pseudomonas citronellolis]